MRVVTVRAEVDITVVISDSMSFEKLTDKLNKEKDFKRIYDHDSICIVSTIIKYPLRLVPKPGLQGVK